jgi:predicted metal-dependent hydrolase
MPAALGPTRDTALAAFLHAFDDGAFFEAHEILETFWVDYRGDDRSFYQGLIQAAVALHHASAGNAIGAQASPKGPAPTSRPTPRITPRST